MDKATLAAETKKLAKDIGKNLTNLKHPVPHSVLLHALSQVAGINDWRVLTKEQTSKTPPEIVIMASADCDIAQGRQSVVFNITPWLKSLDDEALELFLTNDNDTNKQSIYPNIIPWLLAHTHKTTLHSFAEMNEHIATNHLVLVVDVPCKDVANWIETERADVLNRVLCNHFDVGLSQAEEEEIYGMWDWFGTKGNACEHSFDTEEEAMQNAVTQLDLKDQFFANKGWDVSTIKRKAKNK